MMFHGNKHFIIESGRRELKVVVRVKLVHQFIDGLTGFQDHHKTLFHLGEIGSGVRVMVSRCNFKFLCAHNNWCVCVWCGVCVCVCVLRREVQLAARERGRNLLLLLLLLPLLQLLLLLAVSFTSLLLLLLLLTTLVLSHLLEVVLLLPLSGRLFMLPLPLSLPLLLVKPVHLFFSKVHQQVHQQPGKHVVLLPLVADPESHTL